jgi:hypothetical protein
MRLTILTFNIFNAVLGESENSAVIGVGILLGEIKIASDLGDEGMRPWDQRYSSIIYEAVELLSGGQRKIQRHLRQARYGIEEELCILSHSIYEVSSYFLFFYFLLFLFILSLPYSPEDTKPRYDVVNQILFEQIHFSARYHVIVQRYQGMRASCSCSSYHTYNTCMNILTKKTSTLHIPAFTIGGKYFISLEAGTGALCFS